MSGAELGMVVAVFIACAVEAVEALTIVLALGTTRDWHSSLAGAGVALLVLAALVAALGPALTSLPLGVLRLLVGGLLLTFGLQWLRKAILRGGGLKDMHDELLAYREETDAALAAGVSEWDLDAAGREWKLDGYSFAVCFKGVLLEGLEVAFIVLTFGANAHHVGLAALAALAALLVVVGAGVAVRAPLARVPENRLKFLVGVMLSSFGIFWGTEGAGASWPGDELALLVIIPAVLAFGAGLTWALRRGVIHPRAAPGMPPRIEVVPGERAEAHR
jgi:uncharacterized membrane protein